MGKLTTLVGKFSTRGKDKSPPPDQTERQEETPPKQREIEPFPVDRNRSHPDRNGRQGAELSEESDRGEGYHDIAAFGSDVSAEFKPNTYSGELDGLVVTRPAFQSMVYHRPANAVGGSKACASCRNDADPRHPGSLLTAECGHTFHFECIAQGLDLGQLRCPLCRKTWHRLPDTGGWANGALGYSYQGQPMNRKDAGAPRPPRSVRRSRTPPLSTEGEELDPDDIPMASVLRPPPPPSGIDPPPDVNPHGGSLDSKFLKKAPTFQSITDANSFEPSPPESSYRGNWAKRSTWLESEEYEAEQSPGDPFDFHQRFSDSSPNLDDLPSPVALKRGGNFAKRRGGGEAQEPEFAFGTSVADENGLSLSHGGDLVGVNTLFRAASAEDAPVQAPVSDVNTPIQGPASSVNTPPLVFARRRRTSKDSSATPLPSIIETSPPEQRNTPWRISPKRRTPPVSPRRRYERRQASNPDSAGGSSQAKEGSDVSPPGEKRRSPSSEGGARAGGLAPPPGRANLPPPPGKRGVLLASKQDDLDWATFFSPSTRFESPPESTGFHHLSTAKGSAKAPHVHDLSPEDPNFATRGGASRFRRGKVGNPERVGGNADELVDMGRYAKALKVLGVLPEPDLNPPNRSGAIPLSPEASRGSLSPTEERHPSRGFPDHLESVRTSVPPEDGTWSSMDETERDIQVDTNSKIVYSRSWERPSDDGDRPSPGSDRPNNGFDRPNPLADSRGWFYNSDFDTAGVSHMLRGVEALRGANQPAAWRQSSGHQFGGSLQAEGGFNIARFEAAIGPEVFDDDDPVTSLQPLPGNVADLEISVRSECPAVAAGEFRDKFLCLITVKASPLVKPLPPSLDRNSPSPLTKGASSHHRRRPSETSRSTDSGAVRAPGVPSRRRHASRGSGDLESISDHSRSGGERLQRAGSADVALLQPLERRDSADLDGWLTDQMTERLRLQEGECPTSEPVGGASKQAQRPPLEEARAPLDLVAVLDVSKSMMGRKLRLVQKTIEFVAQNLGPNDRLSVVAFAKKAYRVTPLVRLTERGREQTIAAVKRIEVSSGTNIGAGLRMGLKVLKDARTRNPVRAVVLLSDGQDSWGRREMALLLPDWTSQDWRGTAVHTFGFGRDHDAEAMFSVASEAKGTYSFIRKTDGVQDAFARCIGGLLSVVAQDVTLSLEMGPVHGAHRGNGAESTCRIQQLHAGVFERTVAEDGTRADIALGELYAEEERDILVELSLPTFLGRGRGARHPGDERQLVLGVSGSYIQARTQLIKAVRPVELRVSRPIELSPGEGRVDIDVDRQRNRLLATRAMSTAREWAELGQLGAAQKMLESGIAQIGQSFAFAERDPLTMQLDHDLRECAVGFASMEEYEERGRAFSMAQGLSHAMQRASTSTFRRGSRTSSAGYNTSTMEFMINRSQCFESPS